ncbi:flagellar basal body rod protein FlgB [Salisediminibacterium selenitireducens]|uniref:Flagellar basal body rod protein FlgB n=1 Tax=Bacillus selenitireducens (strain ATCC 700615 / DSM 15326 / MLS10) TaxID=439292 RepID=D6XTW0_BACIE|nr:flagellar basal body rod protein FlgB [Salisediminibacterium selenitireducens]ADH99246.1 flagellar basal-body rod protein FlgB [[Bacillus] selenitireducens MLS10]
MNIINNPLNQLLETSLNASARRQDTISDNVANVDTPNYKAKKTVFNHQLQRAMDDQRLRANRLDDRHIEFGGPPRSDAPHIIERTNTQYNHNGNNVDIDKEMADMAENQIYYNALIDRMNGRFNSVRTAMGRGR